jgi:uncharacterized protein YgbK (DUF1537 family)
VQAGFSAEVQMRFCAGSDADVVCVDTETRSLPPEAADALAGKVARSIAAAHPELVYKKCDSVLRGPVAAESLAIARALARIFHKLSGFSRLARVPEEKLDWTALVFRFRQNLGLIPL